MNSSQRSAVSDQFKIQWMRSAHKGLDAVPWTDVENGHKFISYDNAQKFLREHGAEEMQRQGWSFRIVPSDFESAAVLVEDDCS